MPDKKNENCEVCGNKLFTQKVLFHNYNSHKFCNTVKCPLFNFRVEITLDLADPNSKDKTIYKII